MIQITVVHQAALGDTILLVPLFRALRTKFGKLAAITFVTRPNFGQMLTMLGFVDAYASADDREHSAWFAPSDASAAAAPAWAGADFLISAVSNSHDAWAQNARASRAARGNAGLYFFEPRPPADFPRHVTEWHREQLGQQGLALDAPEVPLPRLNPDGALLIHPGSGGDAKCWPREKFIALARNLKRNGIVPTFILGEAEQERWGRTLIEELQAEFPWYLHMGLYELADRMSRARLYLGNDSGVTHVAAAMGVPVLALFGPTNDVQWRPIGPSVKIIRNAPPHETSLESLEEAAVLHEVLANLRVL